MYGSFRKTLGRLLSKINVTERTPKNIVDAIVDIVTPEPEYFRFSISHPLDSNLDVYNLLDTSILNNIVEWCNTTTNNISLRPVLFDPSTSTRFNILLVFKKDKSDLNELTDYIKKTRIANNKKRLAYKPGHWIVRQYISRVDQSESFQKFLDEIQLVNTLVGVNNWRVSESNSLTETNWGSMCHVCITTSFDIQDKDDLNYIKIVLKP